MILPDLPSATSQSRDCDGRLIITARSQHSVMDHCMCNTDGDHKEAPSGALFDPSHTYRYTLWRTWDLAKPRLCFCMLNPSTADATTLDNTVRRCYRYAHDWGHGRLDIVNLFARISTDPHQLFRCNDPIGPDNDRHIGLVAARADLIIIAWGVHGGYRQRDRDVLALLPGNVSLLALTKHGYPKHPLYCRADIVPTKAAR